MLRATVSPRPVRRVNPDQPETATSAAFSSMASPSKTSTPAKPSMSYSAGLRAMFTRVVGARRTAGLPVNSLKTIVVGNLEGTSRPRRLSSTPHRSGRRCYRYSPARRAPASQTRRVTPRRGCERPTRYRLPNAATQTLPRGNLVVLHSQIAPHLGKAGQFDDLDPAPVSSN